MELFYREAGEKGNPVVILHGLFGMSDNWMRVAKKMASFFHVYIPDLRNHGRSPHSDIHNYFTLSDDIHEFLHARKLDSAVLIGHSMGGKAAMMFASEYPQMVHKLIIVDICQKAYPLRHYEMIREMKAIDFDRLKHREEVALHLSKKIKSERVRLVLMKNLYHVDHERLGWRINVDALERNIDDILAKLPENTTYEGETLFIRGENSDYIELSDFANIKKAFPGSVITTIPNATHWLHAEQPDLFLARVLDFLRDNS